MCRLSRGAHLDFDRPPAAIDEVRSSSPAACSSSQGR